MYVFGGEGAQPAGAGEAIEEEAAAAKEEAEEVVAVEFSGSDLEIGFNVSYLLDVLGVMSADGVKLSVSDANSSALLESSRSDDALYVVMPMRL